MTKRFYHFRQNNSGGSFKVDEMVCKHVFIEAPDAQEANRLALDMGIYFDGVCGGLDCGCCGDRWDEAYGDGENYPLKYSDKVTFDTPEEYARHLTDDSWGLDTMPNARIYYADGKTVKEISAKEAEDAT